MSNLQSPISNLQFLINFLFLFTVTHTIAQTPKKPEDYGFRYEQMIFKGDTVDILIKSKKGEEQKSKPLFFFCQGSMPQPLIKYDEGGLYGVFPFNPDSLSVYYHLVIVSKPYIPLMCDVKTLGQNFMYVDGNGKMPKKYMERNLPDYYVKRNIEVIRFLQKKVWVEKRKLIVAGHSEGSGIAARLASKCKKVTRLIYSGGNPMGRIMSIVGQSRAAETDTDSTLYGEKQIADWKNTVENKNDMNAEYGDTYKATFDFSEPLFEKLEKLKIPVLVTYGTKDWCAPFNDFLQIDTARKGLKNFTFKTYIGTEHNFFPLLPDGRPDYNVFNWDKVAGDWLGWLEGVKNN